MAFDFPFCLYLEEKKFQNVNSPPSSHVYSELLIFKLILISFCVIIEVTIFNWGN